MNYLILGANAAELSAAVRILKNEQSAKITVLEKSSVVSFGSCGIPYYVAGEFSDIEQMTARPYQDFIKLGIDIKLQHQAIGIDSSSKMISCCDLTTSTTLTFSYDKLLIAVGASPSRPPIQGLDTENVMTMHSRYDAQNLVAVLPEVKNVVIIGIEAAEAFAHQGKKTTVIEFSARILAKTFDEQMTSLLQNELVNNGVNLRTDEAVKAIISHNGKVSEVVTNKARYPADLVVVATGFQPNTNFLAESGIELTKQGTIIIDKLGQTNITDIYAADCATVTHCILGNTFIPSIGNYCQQTRPFSGRCNGRSVPSIYWYIGFKWYSCF